MNKINFIFAFFIAFAIIGCDIVEPPYRKGGDITPVDTTKKKVLLEDFTGFRCGNCPEATHVAEMIANQYPGRVIVIALHAGPLAVPTPIRRYDFRTQETNELATFYGLIATPYGLVNRRQYVGQNLLAPTAWGGYVQEQLNVDADLKMYLETDFNESTREISLQVQLEYLRQGNVNHNLAVYILEDSVVQYQQDDRQPAIHISDYVHNHVMRGSFTGTWGLPVSDVAVSAGSKLTVPFKYTISSERDWRPSKLSLVAFVHDNTTKEVIQVEQIKLFKE
ncbi:MAG: Omp28 family outer membrane lipoprotein [Candidatus Kapabacteria bacterium]|nr:Omp28 family outer membrane lipoprotein [Ignavibacteriota bacterium]MCW5884742.1 Omp28 family outer membrane lipoprotein [Candidatus Kapabacteria bacterium]